MLSGLRLAGASDFVLGLGQKDYTNRWVAAVCMVTFVLALRWVFRVV